ncbi:MAG TPA: DUF1080 domain-containing protein [Saprospiraceae bacterium]|nr:DUF1080 domain-containing protein [Saprospiraceae bacterium]
MVKQIITHSLLILNLLFFITKIEAQLLDGRWNITVTKGEKKYPAWLEVIHSGMKTKVGKFVYIVGSARPISKILIVEDKFSFTIPPQWDNEDADLTLVGTLVGDKIEGMVREPNGVSYPYKGVRAPKMIKTVEPKWGKATKLFDGQSLNGWRSDGDNNNWIASNGILKNQKSGANLMTDKTFGDFKFHIEFKVPKGGNSGIYLRGRYEVQVSDSKEPSTVDLGGIYGFVKALELPAQVADVWHSYDITLVGRIVTVVLDGKTVVCRAEIPGITGGAIDSNEDSPGPIYLQGDHTEVEYRNIKIAVAK